MNTYSTTSSSTYYCHSCADDRGLLNDLHLTSTSPSAYQIEKARKHTKPTSSAQGVNSVLNSGSTIEYDELARKAFDEGMLEIESNGCRSLVYISTEIIGARLDSGTPKEELNSFRWVLSTGSSLAHGRPVESKDYSSATCSVCGSALSI